MGVLFVLLILLLLAFAVDYILFHFEKPPIFALTKETEGGTEHIGLLYIVSDYTAAQPGRAMEWDWIWNKYRIERVD